MAGRLVASIRSSLFTLISRLAKKNRPFVSLFLRAQGGNFFEQD